MTPEDVCALAGLRGDRGLWGLGDQPELSGSRSITAVGW